MLQAHENYVYGTAAEKIQYDVYEENNVLKAKKKQKAYNKIKLKVVMLILLAFGLCLTVIVRYAMITELNYSINKELKKYNEIKNENSRLKVAIDKDLDLGRIKETAEKKLGMQKPDKYQIVYMKVAKNDYTEVADTYRNVNKANNSMFAAVRDKLWGIVRFLY